MGGKASLTYYIFDHLLEGQTGGKAFRASAHSGGGGGSKSTSPGWQDDSVRDNPYMTFLKQADQDKGPHAKGGPWHGGPIPVGDYTIHTPAIDVHLGLSARLTPAQTNVMFNRGGFFIHGRGPHGSDGCIVPLKPAEFQHFMSALVKDGGGVLAVRETMAGGQPKVRWAHLTK